MSVDRNGFPWHDEPLPTTWDEIHRQQLERTKYRRPRPRYQENPA